MKSEKKRTELYKWQTLMLGTDVDNNFYGWGITFKSHTGMSVYENVWGG